MSGAGPPHGLGGRADVGAFLGRLTRFDPAALVRLRSAGAPHTVLWGRLPWGVLVTRSVAGAGPGDATVRAADLLAEIERGGTSLPRRYDEGWHWPLPPVAGQVVIETVTAAEVRRLAAAAAGALRSAAAHGVGGRRVGQRLVRDTLLDHVALVITETADRPAPGGPDERVEVTQRLIQAIFRMGFLGPDETAQPTVQVRLSGRWVGISAQYGVAWIQRVNTLPIRPIATHTNG